jgi:hypothetical protein
VNKPNEMTGIATPEHHAEEHVAGVIDGQVHAGQAEQGYDHASHDLGVQAGAARHDQAVHGT